MSTPQGLQDNVSIIINGVDTLEKFIDATLFELTLKSTKKKKNLTNISEHKTLMIRF